MITRMADLLGHIRFPGLAFEVTGEEGERCFLRVHAYAASPYAVHTGTDEAFPWYGRKWRLSPHMTDGEIVQTAFKAVLTALEHEARERFTYKGVSVFDPHYDIEALVALRRSPNGGLKERA